MAQFNIAEAKARLSELLHKAMVGEEIIIARDSKPIAKLVPLTLLGGKRQPGSAKGRIWIAPDFDAALEDFVDYT